MASSSTNPSLLILVTFSLLLHHLNTVTAADNPGLSDFNHQNKNMTHVRFYLHNVVSGPNKTAVRVVSGPSNESFINFGDITVFDDALTEGPDLTSKLVGRAQGVYVDASMGEPILLSQMNVVFTGGEYNGSTLAVTEWNPFLRELREYSVVGGTGRFRLARGFVLSRTLNFTLSFSSHVYDVYVVHG